MVWCEVGGPYMIYFPFFHHPNVEAKQRGTVEMA